MAVSLLVTRNGDQLVDENGTPLVVTVGEVIVVPRVFPLHIRLRVILFPILVGALLSYPW